VGAAIGGLILISEDDAQDQLEPEARSAPFEPTPESVVRATRQALTGKAGDKTRGIVVRYPAAWSQDKRDGLIILKSPDRCAAVTLSAPGPPEKATAIRKEALKALRRSFKRITVRPGSGDPIGGVPTTGRVVDFEDRKGRPVRIILSVGTGSKYAYLSQTLLRGPSCSSSLLDAQLILSTLELSK